MADALYEKGAERIGRAQLNLETANIKAVLVKTSYVQDLATHEFYSSISAHVSGAPVALTNKSFAGGRFDADDIVIVAPPAGDQIEAVALFVDSGNEATSPLLGYFTEIAGVPFTSNGFNQRVVWSNGSNRIFRI